RTTRRPLGATQTSCEAVFEGPGRRTPAMRRDRCRRFGVSCCGVQQRVQRKRLDVQRRREESAGAKQFEDCPAHDGRITDSELVFDPRESYRLADIVE